MASDLVKNCKDLSGLSACKCCCFENLLATKRSTGVTCGILTCGCYLCIGNKFLVVSYCVCFYKLFKACVFVESYHELRTVEVSCMLPKMVLSIYTWVYKDLSRWSTLSICFLAVDSL